MKIHILGAPGSGKSYVAKVLAKKFGLPVYDLDDVFWDKISSYYGSQNHPDRRTEIVSKILEKDSWIIEGVYFSWLEESFRGADYIFVLKTNVGVRDWRIIKRFFMRKLKLAPAPRRESFKNLRELLKWNHRYDSKDLVQAVKMLKKHNDKVIILTKNKDIFKTFRKPSR
ncbi:AAA family ATPase [Bacillus sp. REN3]|uniref:AAA family ATPase n=1 Tax=Bacillus sp. REN3 TaxID=2802440 RepID=UPI001AEDAB33|nr:AAA family ATPase [Bacillus sp. REN3]